MPAWTRAARSGQMLDAFQGKETEWLGSNVRTWGGCQCFCTEQLEMQFPFTEIKHWEQQVREMGPGDSPVVLMSRCHVDRCRRQFRGVLTLSQAPHCCQWIEGRTE